ncbi:MAG: LptA/OstA family protein, partial [Verrucomicrobiales bacterium]
TAIRAVSSFKTRSTNEFVEIFADQFRFQEAKTTNEPGIAYYTGNVRVAQPQGELSCQELTIYFTPKENKLFRAIAETEVVVAREDGTVRGDRAVYELAEEKITMTGNPIWEFGERNGSSSILTFYPETEELYALQNVRMTMPSANRASGIDFSRGKKNDERAGKAGKNGAETNGTVQIAADTFSHRGDLSVFSGNVLVKDKQGEMTAELLTILTGGSNQVHRITAERKVVIRQPDMMAEGKKAVYHATNGIVELTGDPVITAPDKRVRADLFWINREENTFSFKGNYKLEANQETTFGTNSPVALFPVKPQPKKKNAKQ